MALGRRGYCWSSRCLSRRTLGLRCVRRLSLWSLRRGGSGECQTMLQQVQELQRGFIRPVLGSAGSGKLAKILTFGPPPERQALDPRLCSRQRKQPLLLTLLLFTRPSTPDPSPARGLQAETLPGHGHTWGGPAGSRPRTGVCPRQRAVRPPRPGETAKQEKRVSGLPAQREGEHCSPTGPLPSEPRGSWLSQDNTQPR